LRMQSSQAHCVSGAFADYNKPQTVAQAVRCLMSLEKTMNCVFDRILSRVSEETARLGSIDQRIATAQLKVEKVSQQNTGTTIHCIAKYPGKEQVEPFKCVNHDLPFKGMTDIEAPSNEAIFRPAQTRVLAKQEQALMALYSAVNPDMSVFNHGLKEGLGKLPPYLPSATGMLLFDTKETPYKDYNVLVSLMGRNVKARDAQEKRNLQAAPPSLNEATDGPRKDPKNIMFQPSAPEISTQVFEPLAFPSGPQPATDVNFQSGDLPDLLSIAPTAHQSAPELPPLPALMDAPGAATSAIPGPPPPLGPPAEAAAPPPPPPPPVAPAPAAPRPQHQTVPVPPPPASFATPAAAPSPATNAPPRRAAPGGLLAEIARGKKLKKPKKRKKKKKKELSMREQLQLSLRRRAGMLNPQNKKRKKKKKIVRKKKTEAAPAPASKLNLTVMPKSKRGDSDNDDWTDSD